MTYRSDDAWADLQVALPLLAKHQNGPDPFHCAHDVLSVMSDPKRYDESEIEELYQLGFLAGDDGECFISYRFGSA